MLENGRNPCQEKFYKKDRPSNLVMPPEQESKEAKESAPILYSPQKDVLLIGKQEKEIVFPTNEELVTYGVSHPKEKSQRTSTDIALALDKPHMFLSKEVEGQFAEAKKVSSEVKQVMENLKKQGQEQILSPQEALNQFNSRVLVRDKTKKEYTSRLTGEREVVEITKPGAFEQVSLAAISSLEDTTIKNNASTVVFKPLAKLLRNYRIFSSLREPVEMPDLATKLANEVDHFPAERKTRYSIYSILEQTAIPPSLQEVLVKKMDEHKDLEHPFAFQLTHAIATREPDSSWISVQKERRQALLETLHGTNQELFENFDELVKKSEGLVVSADPTSPAEGKVGMEMEFRPSPVAKKLNRYYGEDTVNDFKGFLSLTALDNGWCVGSDVNNLEIRRREGDHLEHNNHYSHELIRLKDWFGNFAQDIRSIHIHLDRDRHPHMPTLGNLFAEQVGVKAAIGPSADYPTWEVRPLNVPRLDGNMHPGRIEDLVTLYINAANEQPKKNPQKLSVDASNELTVKKMTWGHIVTHLENPEGRLAALMALKDPMALASVTPLSFANSVEKKGLTSVAEKLQNQFSASIDQEMVEGLRAYGEGNFRSWYHGISYPVTDVVKTSLGYWQLAEVIGREINEKE